MVIILFQLVARVARLVPVVLFIIFEWSVAHERERPPHERRGSANTMHLVTLLSAPDFLRTFFAQNRGWFKFVATVSGHVLEEVGDKTCGSERLQQRRHLEKGGPGDRERSEQYNRIRARSARNMFLLAFLLWLNGLDHGCHHPFVPLPRRFAFHLHAMFHLAIVVHSLSQEAQPPPPR